MAIAFVQSGSQTGTGSSLTVTLGANTTAGNCLVVCSLASAGNNPAVSGITLGGAADHFGQLVSAGTAATTASILEIWADPNCAGGQTSVVTTFSFAASNGCSVFVYEFSGLKVVNTAAAVLDQSSTSFTTVTNPTFTSGTTGVTAQPSELFFGGVGGHATTITGPASPWIDSSQINAGAAPKNQMVGYQIPGSATGTISFTGSYSPNSFSEAAVVTLLGALSGAAQPRATVLVPRRSSARGALGAGTGLGVWATVAGKVAAALGPAGTVQPRATVQLPRRAYARAVWSGPAVLSSNASATSGSVPAMTVNRTEIISRVTGRIVRR